MANNHTATAKSGPTSTNASQQQAPQAPQRQSSIPVANSLLSTVNASRQRVPMCGECEKSLPNQIVFDKIESIIRRMQDENTGLPVKTAKSFMTKIPSVFTGIDLIQWMMKNLRLEDQQEAIHLANLIASHGYIFPIEDHTLSIKNDCTFYRFQTPCLWPSNNIDPENTDYAVYLCKRTMQGKTRLELADYEAENLARLQKMFSRKWEFIFMQAESQAKVDKKRDKLERKVLDSQERAFWDVYRPVPGCVNTTELDIKKACRLSKSAKRCDECQKIFDPNKPASKPEEAVDQEAGSSRRAPAGVRSQQAGPSQAAAAAVATTATASLGQVQKQNQQQSQVQGQQPAVEAQKPQVTQTVAGARTEEPKSNEIKPSKESVRELRAIEAEQAKNGQKSGSDGPGETEGERHQQADKSNVRDEQKQESGAKSDSKDQDKAVAPNEDSESAKVTSSKQLAHQHHHHHHHHPHQHQHQHATHPHPHPHHHHHHHHHHHPHSHAHHAHHHHHHHKQCPHYHKQQQLLQQAKQAGDQTEPARCANNARCSLKVKQRVAGSSDQLNPSASTSAANSRRKSECSKISSMSGIDERGSIVKNTTILSKEPNTSSASNGEQSAQKSIVCGSIKKPTPSDERPASACCSLSSMSVLETNPKAMASQAQAGSSKVAKTSSSNQQCGQLQRKSSLNIARPPSADQVSGMLAAPLDASKSTCARKGSVSSATGHQRAQLKGAQSVCTPSLSLNHQKHPTAATSANSASSQELIGARLQANQQQGANASREANSMNELERELESLRIRLDRGGVKMSKVTQSYLSYFNQWAEYDPFIAQPIPSNPWQSDSTELWDSERQTKDVHFRRVRRWAFSLKELLNDPAGRGQFHRFLEKEFSAENLKFWDAVQELKRVHAKDVGQRVEAIWTEYLAQDANCPINIDSKSYETSKKNMAKNKNNRYIFDEAAGHVYQLMKNDSYPRYLRSDMYKDYKDASERRRPNQVAFDVFKPQITTLKHKFNF